LTPAVKPLQENEYDVYCHILFFGFCNYFAIDDYGYYIFAGNAEGMGSSKNQTVSNTEQIMEQEQEKLKPFIVTVEIEIVVMAKDKDDATDWAQHHESDWLLDEISSAGYYAQHMTHAPIGWEDDYLVYGDGEEMTLKEAKELSPEYQKMLAEYKIIHFSD